MENQYMLTAEFQNSTEKMDYSIKGTGICRTKLIFFYLKYENIF